jgi:hypothetical protein
MGTDKTETPELTQPYSGGEPRGTRRNAKVDIFGRSLENNPASVGPMWLHGRPVAALERSDNVANRGHAFSVLKRGYFHREVTTQESEIRPPLRQICFTPL